MRVGGFAPGIKLNPLKARRVAGASALVESSFAPNPGNLRMFQYLPPGLKAGAPLVVVLHGCGQTASGYDAGTGWCQLADQLGFAVLAAEQKALNNPNTCFNWFNPEDITRDTGEAASIAAMVRSLLETQKLDAGRVFVTGLSAGGAMTAVMLATYPELFAGGAIIGGLPFGAAANVREALDAMRSAPLRTPQQWGNAVRAASTHAGPWPKLSIWHGALDPVVNISNAQASLAQWADLHGLSLSAARQDVVDGAIRLRWDDRLEVYTLATLGHGTPIDSSDLGAPAPFILEAGISSTRHIAAFWGLAPVAAPKAVPQPARVHITPPPLPQMEAALEPEHVRIFASVETMETKVDNIIRRALRAAGVLKS